MSVPQKDAKETAARALDVMSRQVDVSVADPGATVRAKRGSSPRVRAGAAADEGAQAGASGAAPTLDRSLPSLGNDFEIVSEIGRGGMGVVELARQRSLGREVAIKRALDPSRRAMVEALLREAQISGRLEHPNVVPVHALGRGEGGDPVLVMKHVEGISWRTLVRDPDHPAWEEVRGDRLVYHLRVLIQVCRAVELCHDRGLLHRDIKLDNVMIGRFGEVYLLDFGLAIELTEAAALAADRVEGTATYMAPEMLEPESGIDERADVFLLGATLHHVLTGTPRHRGDLYAQVLFQAALSDPCEHDADLPAELAEICRRSTHRQKDERYATVRALRQALEDYLLHRDSIALAAAAAERLAVLRSGTEDGTLDATDVGAIFRECHFGFHQALRGWSENGAAHEGLQETLTIMLQHELAQRDPAGARALLPEITDPPPEIEARIAALEAELAHERGASEKLAQLEGTFDERIGEAERGKLAWVIGVTLLATSVITATDTFLGTEWLTSEDICFSGFVLMFVGLALAFRVRKALRATRFNSTMALVIFAASMGVLLNRVIGVGADEPIAKVIAGDAVIIAVALSIASAVLRRVFVFGTLGMASAAVLGSLYPKYALAFVALAGAVAVLSVLLARGSWRKPLFRLPGS